MNCRKIQSSSSNSSLDWSVRFALDLSRKISTALRLSFAPARSLKNAMMFLSSLSFGIDRVLAWNHFGNENRLCREKMAYVRTGEPFVRSPSKKLPPLELAGGYLVNLGEELGTFMHRK